MSNLVSAPYLNFNNSITSPWQYRGLATMSGSSITDWTPAFTAMFASGCKEFKFEAETYPILSALSFPSGSILTGRGSSSSIFSRSTSGLVMDAVGSVGSSLNFSVNGSAGDTSIHLASTTGIVSGSNLLLVGSTTASSQYDYVQFVTATSNPSGGVVNIEPPLNNSFLTANGAYVKVITYLDNPIIADIGFIGAGNTDGNNCTIQYANNPILDRVRVNSAGRLNFLTCNMPKTYSLNLNDITSCELEYSPDAFFDNPSFFDGNTSGNGFSVNLHSDRTKLIAPRAVNVWSGVNIQYSVGVNVIAPSIDKTVYVGMAADNYSTAKVFGGRIERAGEYGCDFVGPNHEIYGLSVVNGAVGGAIFENATGSRWIGGEIRNNGSTNADHAFTLDTNNLDFIEGSNDILIDGVQLSGFPGSGFYINSNSINANRIHLINCTVDTSYPAAGGGIRVYKTNYLTVKNLTYIGSGVGTQQPLIIEDDTTALTFIGDRTFQTDEIDLSGSAILKYLYLTKGQAVIPVIKFFATVATDANTGKTMSIYPLQNSGQAVLSLADGNTVLSSKAQYSITTLRAGGSNLLLDGVIPEGVAQINDQVVFSYAGGKTGTGKLIVSMELLDILATNAT